MKTRFAIATMILSSLVLSISCQKETPNEQAGIPNDALLLLTEGYTSNNKTSVSNTSVQWDGDESVNLNGTNYTVVVSGSNAYADNASALANVSTIYGYYGCGSVTNSQTTTPTVTIPANYACSIDGNGRQVIPLPMAAYRNATGNAIEFKHLTAAVHVTVWNATANTLYIDSVVITTAKYRINGSLELTLTSTNYGIGTDNTSVPADERKVKITFATPLEISTGEANAKSVQVPIMPIGADDMTIKVYSHNADITGLPFSGLTHTFNHVASAVALDRNVMLTAKIKMDPSNSHVTSKGAFSVSDEAVVYFSKGNLQFQANSTGAAAAPYTAVWRFAENQYNYIAAQSGNTDPSESQTGWQDLFGWGTSGYNHGAVAYQPWTLDNVVNDYYAYGQSTYNLFDGNGQADWGYNAISNGGNTENSGWRTLTMEEWDYLLNTRSTTHRFAKAIVHNRKGLLIFPDVFDPTIVDPAIGYINSGTANFNNNINDDEWDILEAAGCVFLPAAGYRSIISNEVKIQSYGEQCWYWTSSKRNQYNAYNIKVYKTSIASGSSSMNNLGAMGLSVRLVRNAN